MCGADADIFFSRGSQTCFPPENFCASVPLSAALVIWNLVTDAFDVFYGFLVGVVAVELSLGLVVLPEVLLVRRPFVSRQGEPDIVKMVPALGKGSRFPGIACGCRCIDDIYPHSVIVIELLPRNFGYRGCNSDGDIHRVRFCCGNEFTCNCKYQCRCCRNQEFCVHSLYFFHSFAKIIYFFRFVQELGWFILVHFKNK